MLDNSVLTGWYMEEQAMRYKLSSYDAAYLELAMRHGIPLASQDGKLLEAAKAAGVSLA